MPLYFPDEHKPKFLPRIVELQCRDSDTHRPVELLVGDKCIEDHAGQPFGEFDRAKILDDVLDRIISQASEVYDSSGKPVVFELHDARTSRV